MVFAGIKTRIFSGALANSLNEGNRLIDTHRATGIMTVLFEIEHEQDARWSRQRTGLRPRIGDDTEEMIGLPHGIGRISVMICPPKQARLGGGLLSGGILRIAIETRVGRLMNDADNPLAFHRGKIRPHQVVMRKINNVAGGKRARWQREKKTGSTNNRQFHSTRKRQPSYGAMRAHLQEHSLCVLCSGPASFHFASDSESAADTTAARDLDA